VENSEGIVENREADFGTDIFLSSFPKLWLGDVSASRAISLKIPIFTEQ
jgi:hypothetical protein